MACRRPSKQLTEQISFSLCTDAQKYLQILCRWRRNFGWQLWTVSHFWTLISHTVGLIAVGVAFHKLIHSGPRCSWKERFGLLNLVCMHNSNWWNQSCGALLRHFSVYLWSLRKKKSKSKTMHHKLMQELNIYTQNVGELLPHLCCLRGLQHCFVTGPSDSWPDELVELIILHSKMSEQEVTTSLHFHNMFIWCHKH